MDTIYDLLRFVDVLPHMSTSRRILCGVPISPLNALPTMRAVHPGGLYKISAQVCTPTYHLPTQLPTHLPTHLPALMSPLSPPEPPLLPAPSVLPVHRREQRPHPLEPVQRAQVLHPVFGGIMKLGHPITLKQRVLVLRYWPIIGQAPLRDEIDDFEEEVVFAFAVLYEDDQADGEGGEEDERRGAGLEPDGWAVSFWACCTETRTALIGRGWVSWVRGPLTDGHEQLHHDCSGEQPVTRDTPTLAVRFFRVFHKVKRVVVLHSGTS